MKVYVVSQICEHEYFCREVLFVTDNEEIAEEYCKKHSTKDTGWDGITRDEITYQEYILETELPI